MDTQALIPFISRAGTHRFNTHSTWEKLARQARYRPQTLAHMVGVSMRTLQRFFRSRYNKTVSDWLRELRLTEALQMIKSSDSVKKVAFDLGYKQPSHFTRDFKKKFGVSPRTLIKSSRNFPRVEKVQPQN